MTLTHNMNANFNNFDILYGCTPPPSLEVMMSLV